MGNTFSHYVYWMANEISKDAEKRRKVKRDKLWETNPNLRKLIIYPRCPHCACRLDQKDPPSERQPNEDMQPNKVFHKPLLLEPTIVEKHDFQLEDELEIEHGLLRESTKSGDSSISLGSSVADKQDFGIKLVTVAEGVYWRKMNHF